MSVFELFWWFSQDIIVALTDKTNEFGRVNSPEENEDHQFVVGVTQDNENARVPREREKFPHVKLGESVDETEMSKFIGLAFLQGIIRLPSIKDYWATEPFIGQRWGEKYQMNRERFKVICSNLNIVASKPTGENISPAWKVEPLVQLFNQKSKDAWSKIPSTVCVDEGLIPCKARLSFKQYIPNKPTKWGIKTWKMTEPDGYCFEMSIYTGKETHQRGVKTGVGERVVCQLLQKIKPRDDNRVFLMVTDSYFSSFHLAAKLMIDFNTRFLGTLKKSRKHNPPKNFFKDIPEDATFNSISCKSHGIQVTRVKSTKWVPLITTGYSTPKKSEDAEKILDVYRETMGGVDKNDRYVVAYNREKKAKRWYKLVIFYVLEMLLVNAWLIYKRINKSEMPLFDFKLEVIAGLLKTPIQNSYSAIQTNIFTPTKKKRQITDTNG